MTGTREIFEQQREAEMASDDGFAQYLADLEREEQEQPRPQEIQILPGSILTLSKTNAEQFHKQMRDMILNTGYGAFEYLEVINFFIKVKDYINGNKQAKIPEDKELIDFVRSELNKFPRGKLTTSRGVIFETAETGTSYNFDKCADPVLASLEASKAEIDEKLKARKEFLKTLPPEGLTIVDEQTGETSKIFAPVKNSNSSFKCSLPK